MKKLNSTEKMKRTNLLNIHIRPKHKGKIPKEVLTIKLKDKCPGEP
jgi:hypothetical protein